MNTANDRTLSSRTEVIAFLDGLPAVKPGYRRVFRGQTKDYGTLTPAELRQARHPRKDLFKVACFALATEADPSGVDDLTTLLVWTEVIAQHYGPGSKYLDVTTDMDVALWFALNDLKDTPISLVMGDEGPVDPEADVLADLHMLLPGDAKRDPGYLMVLDLPMATSPLDYRHGAVLDLADAPASLSDSSRIAHQHALLAWADSSASGGDLSPFLIDQPIQIAANLQDEISDAVTVDHLFPPPRLDAWYHRLLSVPLVLEQDPESDVLHLNQAIPIALYAKDLEDGYDVTESIICLRPPLLVHELQNRLTPQNREELGGFLPEDATIIVLEEPLYLLTPPIDSGQWFEESIADGLPSVAPVQTDTGSSLDSVQLDRVYLEFSPLELTDWHQVESSTETKPLHAGTYIERSNNEYRIWTITRNLPNGQHEVDGPITFVFDTTAKRFMIRFRNDELREARSVAPFRLKTLLLALGILRDLSPEVAAALFSPRVYDEIHVIPLTGHFTLRPARFKDTKVFVLRSENDSGLPSRKVDRYGIKVIHPKS